MINKHAPLFDFSDYRAYLAAAFSGKRGIKTRFAKALGCSPAFVARVIGGLAQLSVDQALAASQFLDHLDEERDFFLYLVQRERAGTPELRAYFQRKMNQVLSRRSVVRERIGKGGEIDLGLQTTYYSSWIYAAAHVLGGLCRTRDQLAVRLGIPLSKLNPYLDFLLQQGFLAEEGGRFKSGGLGIHLPKDSPMVRSHHLNWRLKALESINVESRHDIHFSGVYVLSNEVLKKLQIRMADLIEEMDNMILPSREETGAAICLDLFQVC